MATPIADTPRLPAGPLVAKVDRMLAHASFGLDPRDGAASTGRTVLYEEMQVNPRRLYEWRKPGAQVQADVADRVLSRSPYLWFDVWVECPRDAEHRVAMMDAGRCRRCDAFHRARFAFTGQRPPRKKRRAA